MTISYYGKKFLKKYNEVENKNLTPKEFFVDIFYPIFYGSDKNLMEVTNSTFSQAAYMINFFIKKELIENNLTWNKNWVEKGNKGYPTMSKLPEKEREFLNKNIDKIKETRKKFLLDEFFKKIKNGNNDASMFVGGYATELTDSTSFNVSTEYDNIIDTDEIFYSWIGHALSLQLGGVWFLSDNEDILYNIFTGWNKYDELLTNPLFNELKSGQISTWNSIYLNNMYKTLPDKKIIPEEKDSLTSISWIKLIFNLSKKYNNTINSYAYKLGQTNETYGIIPIEFIQINNFFDFCSNYFGDNKYLNKPDLFEQIYGTAFGMDKICEFGSIGMIALKPNLFKLEEIKYKNSLIQKEINDEYKNINKNENNSKLYKLYLMATLNLKDIDKESNEIAEFLIKFDTKLTRKNNKILIDNLLSSSNINNFIKNLSLLSEICYEENLIESINILNKIKNLSISNENNLSTLTSLIRFNYTLLKLKEK